MQKTDPPKVLHINESDRELYEKVKQNPGPLKDREWRDIFMLCVSLGFKQGAKLPLEKSKTFLLRTESLLPAQRTLLNAIVVKDSGSLEAIGDQKAVMAMAEEYANAGIQILKDRYLGDTDRVFVKELEAEMLTLVQSHTGAMEE